MRAMRSESSNVTPEQNFNTGGFHGAMQQVFQDNAGNHALVEFPIGTNAFVLHDEVEARYIPCDILAAKFVAFLLPGCHR